MTDTCMQLEHYQDDKLFSCCHDETAVWFFRPKCLRGERRCHILILRIELHMLYGETHGGSERGFRLPGK